MLWNINVPIINHEFYNVALWFIIYSVLGWFVESIYMSYCNKKITNRGMVKGPFCPIYGFGGIMCHTIMSALPRVPIIIFFSGSLLATTFEYLVGIGLVYFLGELWWDYNDKPFNYKGIICLESSLAWGMYAILDIYVLYNIIFRIISMIPIKYGKAIIVLFTVYYSFAICVVIKNHIGGGKFGEAGAGNTRKLI
ncbi:MAG: putative ABC transporter permease [Lachnospiraceae bacterium]|jgi:uncharacterized membrane protein|nr:putative ABC transporter permease [Lachnospiraceae bacterium]MBQ5475063.1 putative ABC transporter permease [Lachnospiraceae bacterium]